MDTKKYVKDFFIISIVGTLGHFLYELTSNNKLVGYIFPVNESTWEHLKLLFFPALVLSVIECFIYKEKHKNFLPSSIFAILCGMLWIVTVFYTYRGILGFNIDFLNILIYYISVIIFIKKRNYFILNDKFTSKNAKIITIVLALLFLTIFICRSYHPSEIGIFAPPETIKK